MKNEYSYRIAVTDINQVRRKQGALAAVVSLAKTIEETVEIIPNLRSGDCLVTIGSVYLQGDRVQRHVSCKGETIEKAAAAFLDAVMVTTVKTDDGDKPVRTDFCILGWSPRKYENPILRTRQVHFV